MHRPRPTTPANHGTHPGASQRGYGGSAVFQCGEGPKGGALAGGPLPGRAVTTWRAEQVVHAAPEGVGKCEKDGCRQVGPPAGFDHRNMGRRDPGRSAKSSLR